MLMKSLIDSMKKLVCDPQENDMTEESHEDVCEEPQKNEEAVAAPQSEKQYLISISEFDVAIMHKMFPSLRYIEVIGVPPSADPQYMLLANPVAKQDAPKEPEQQESAKATPEEEPAAL